jgi:outer membrane protein TolC
MHSASASVGVAVNDMLPQITLTPFIGTQANSLGAMFGPGTYFWSLVGSATQTVFDGGALLHKKRR